MKLLDDFINNEDLDKTVWRYMSIEKFELMLESRSLYFASAEQFQENDNHEGAITETEYKQRVESIRRSTENQDELNFQLKSLENAFKVLREYAKISCWHLNSSENIAMWNYYQGQDKGIAIETTPRKLIDSVGPYRIKDAYEEEEIYLGRIKYINYASDSMNTRYGFLTTFLYKREPYSYESEIRMIISLRMAAEFGVDTPKEGILVPYDFESSITRTILSPQVDDFLENKVKKILARYNSEIPIEYSVLMNKPRY